jgi:hypothetical protein
MSNGHNLELLTGNEGIVYLNYWDSIAGQDRCFLLRDGKAWEVTSEVPKEVDLAMELVALCQNLDKAVEAFYQVRRGSWKKNPTDNPLDYGDKS